MFFTRNFRVFSVVLVCAACVLFLANARADEKFSQKLDKSDYDAAGLGKLSDAERARLDALVGAYADGQYRTAVVTTEVAPAKNENAEKPEKPGRPEKPKKQKVQIDPGTEIEYNAMDSELVGTFAGFEKGTVFTLANGQRWKVTDGSYVCGPDPRVRKVRVKPGVFGSFFLEFEKVNVRPKVQLLK